MAAALALMLCVARVAAASIFGRIQGNLALLGVKNDVSKFRDEIKDIRHKIDFEEWKLHTAMVRAGRTPEPLIMDQINSAASKLQQFMAVTEPLVAAMKQQKKIFTFDGSQNKLYHEQQRAKNYFAQLKPISDQIMQNVATEMSKYRGTMKEFDAQRNEFTARANADWNAEILNISQNIGQLRRQKAEKKAALRALMGGKEEDVDNDPYASWRKRIISDFKAAADILQAWNDSSPIGALGETIPPLLAQLKTVVAAKTRELQSEATTDATVKLQVDAAMQPPPPATLGAEGAMAQQASVASALKQTVAEHKSFNQQLSELQRVAGNADPPTPQQRTAGLMAALYAELAAMTADVNIAAAKEALSIAMDAHYELTTALPSTPATALPDPGAAAAAAKQIEAIKAQLSSAESRMVIARAQQDSLNASVGKSTHLEMREQELSVQLQTLQQALARFSAGAADAVAKIAAGRLADQAAAIVAAVGAEKQVAVATIAAEQSNAAQQPTPLPATQLPAPQPAAQLPALQTPASVTNALQAAAPAQLQSPNAPDEPLPALSPSVLAKSMPLYPLTRPADTVAELRTQIREALSNIATLQMRIDQENEMLGNPSVLVRIFEAVKMAKMARTDYGLLQQDVALKGNTGAGMPVSAVVSQDDALGRSIDELQKFADLQKLSQPARQPAVTACNRPEHEALLRQYVDDQNAAYALLHCYERKLVELSPLPREQCQQPTDHEDAVKHIKNVADFLESYKRIAPTIPERIKLEEVRQTLRDAVLKVTACHPDVPTYDEVQKSLALLRGTLAFRKGQLMAAAPCGTQDAQTYTQVLEVQKHYEDAMRLVEMASGVRPMACAGPVTEYDAARDDIAKALRVYNNLMVPPVRLDKCTLASNPVDVAQVTQQAQAVRRELNTKLAQWPGHETPSKQEADRRAFIDAARAKITNMLGAAGISDGSRRALQAALTHLGDAERTLAALPASAREDNVTANASVDTSATDYANPPPSTPENYETERAKLEAMERELAEARSMDCASETCTTAECRANKETAQAAAALKTNLVAAQRRMNPGCSEFQALDTRIRELDALQARLDPSAGKKKPTAEELAEKRAIVDKQRALVNKMASDLGIPDGSTAAASELNAAVDKIRADMQRMCPENKAAVEAALASAPGAQLPGSQSSQLLPLTAPNSSTFAGQQAGAQANLGLLPSADQNNMTAMGPSSTYGQLGAVGALSNSGLPASQLPPLTTSPGTNVSSLNAGTSGIRGLAGTQPDNVAAQQGIPAQNQALSGSLSPPGLQSNAASTLQPLSSAPEMVAPVALNPALSNQATQPYGSPQQASSAGLQPPAGTLPQAGLNSQAIGTAAAPQIQQQTDLSAAVQPPASNPAPVAPPQNPETPKKASVFSSIFGTRASARTDQPPEQQKKKKFVLW